MGVPTVRFQWILCFIRTDIAKGLPQLPQAETPLEAARNGYEYYKHLQAHDGHWPGEYGGPMFLIPGLVIGSYVTGLTFSDEERLEMIRYLMNHANEDGGWGMYVILSLDVSESSKHDCSHIEGPSTAFGTSLNYCAIRILGMNADHPVAVKARSCLHKLGRFAIHMFVWHSGLFLDSFLDQDLLWLHLLGVNSGCRS